MSPASAKETHVGVGGSDLSLDQGPSRRGHSLASEVERITLKIGTPRPDGANLGAVIVALP